MSYDFLPRQDVPFVDATGRATNPLYVWLQAMDRALKGGATVAEIEAQIAELRALIEALPTEGFLPATTNIFGQNSVVTLGTLAGGIVIVQLQNDVVTPYPFQYYGADDAGERSWRWLYDALAAGTGVVQTMDGYTVLGVLDSTDGLPASSDVGDAYLIGGQLYAWDGAAWNDEGDASGVTMFSLAELPDSGVGALLAITRDQYGRIAGTKPATITGTSGQIEVANGDAVVGLPTLSLADVPDAGGGEIRKFDRDAKGRVVGTSDATTDDLSEGSTNLYFTAQRVRDVVLTGLSLVSDAAITAADTVLLAFGKLQAQITALASTVSGLITQSITNGDTTHAPSGDAVFDALAGKADDSSVVKTTGAQSGLAGNKSWTGIHEFGSSIIVLGNTFTMDGNANKNFFFRDADGTNRGLIYSVASTRNTALRSYDSSGSVVNGEISIGTQFVITGTAARPSADNVTACGAASSRWTAVYAATGTINTSDAREKSNIRDLTAQELAAASDLAALSSIYQWDEAIAEKGDAARLHCSPTVQSVIACMESHGLDPFRYGFICYDTWDALPEIRDEETGEITQEAREAGDRYSFRMDQLLLFIARGFDARLAALESE